MANTFRTPLISNPIGRNRFPGLVEVVSSFVLSTLALNARAPVPEQPNPPKRPTYVQVEQVQPPLLTTLRLNIQAPIYEISQPSKRPVYVQIDPTPSLLLNTLKSQIGVPFFSVDIANPSRRPIAQEPLQVQAPVLGLLNLNIQSRTPLALNSPKRPVYNQLEPPPNLLPSTLQPTAAIQYLLTQEKDRPNPPRRPIAPEPIQVQAQVLGLLALNAEVPNPLILNSPKRPVYIQVEELGTPIELLQTAAAIPPFVPPVQENPTKKIPSLNIDYSYGALQFAKPTLVILPFSQVDWPTPVARDPDLKALVHTVVSIFGPLPFRQTEQSNPPARIAYRQTDPIGNILVLGIPRQQPFFPGLQENPVRKTPILVSGAFYPSRFAPVAPVVPPTFNNDQPNPSKRPIYYQDFNRGISLTLGIPIPPAPFRQNDQPNPSKRPISYQDQNRQIALEQGIPIPPPPFYQTDFPNPIQGKPRIQMDSILDLQLFTLAPPPVPQPFNTYDWPPPQRRRDIVNQGIFDFGGSVFSAGTNWSIIAGGSGTWTPIVGATNAWGGIVTGDNLWAPINPKIAGQNSGGVT